MLKSTILRLKLTFQNLRLDSLQENLMARWEHIISLRDAEAVCDYLEHLRIMSGKLTSTQRSELAHKRSLVEEDRPTVENAIARLVQKRTRLRARIEELKDQLNAA